MEKRFLMNYVIKNRYILFNTFEKFSDEFIHCYTRGYDDLGREFDFTRRTEKDDPRLFENIKILGEQLGFNPSGMTMVMQMHTDKIKKVTFKDSLQNIPYDRLPVYDAMISDCKGIVLATNHADCVPVYFIDSENKAVGLAHSGWKGTLNLIAPKTARAMKEAYGTDLSKLSCVIGPSICAGCYEIRKDVYDLFTEKHSFAEKYIVPKKDSYRLDLKGLIKETLIREGLSEKNTDVCDLCTACNSSMMYSYRKSGGNCGRSLAVLGIRA
jgi:YfiH family protein